ncbi:MAG: hypothetical protein IJJ33_19635 [Victivallales bacterium]|nr:hypothetical protein [Victivallales bacterium]
MNISYTPGPWFIIENPKNRESSPYIGFISIRQLYGPNGEFCNRLICNLFKHSTPERRQNDIANANLIAAAPYLFESEKQSLRYLLEVQGRLQALVRLTIDPDAQRQINLIIEKTKARIKNTEHAITLATPPPK